MTRPSLASKALLGAIGTYKALSSGRRPSCRFVPSCSEYAAQAVASHGAWRGLGLALSRLGRCRPGGGYGYDPVPVGMPAQGQDAAAEGLAAAAPGSRGPS